MIELARLARNASMLAQCHPVAAWRFQRVIWALEQEHYRPRIQQAWRSAEEQMEAHATDHSDVYWSLHEATSPTGRPEALAVDILDDDSPIVPPMGYLLRLAYFARNFHCQTGILWHLKGASRAKLDAAIVGGATTYHGLVGFDPCHLEIADVTYAAAHGGLRPTVTEA